MKKKKIVILTIYDPNPNMGNRLQNYAVQTVLKKMGFEVTSIKFREDSMNLKKQIKLLIHKMTFYHLTSNKSYWKLMPKQIQSFDEFNTSYIKTCKIKKIEDIPDADFYVMGSDQLWNPKWWADEKPELAKNVYLATFAPAKKKVCFSPSFSVNSLPDEWIPWFKKYISDIPKLAVREDAGRKLIKELTGRDAIVTIDPTLMLDRDDWNKISRIPKGVNKESKYILTYFLGGRSERMNKDIQAYAKQLGAEVYYLFDQEHPEFYFANPSDFIYLISHAQLVLTDSFHACVFSFLYGKPFLLYERIGGADMMSRMETLFDLFDLRRKYVDSGLENDLLECNYENGYQVLKKEREKVIRFLKESMHME